ncbi:MAG: hypothetical protein K2I06_05325 [Ruminococcus sp.]|nr:hypothetical protein [Ruminococcus sp.]
MFKKKMFLMLALLTLTISVTSCANKDNNIGESAFSESSTISDLESDEVFSIVAENTIYESNEVKSDIMTNREFLRLVIDTFEIYSDESFEDDVEKAKFWNILDVNAEIDENRLITPEFLISVSMIATGYIDNTASINEILNCAVKYEVIEKASILYVDINNAKEIVKAARHAYLYPDMYQ